MSVTPGRSREFDTPAGRFVYRSARKDSFSLGVTRVEEGNASFLIASPERALADKIRSDRRGSFSGQVMMHDYLFDDLRLDESGFVGMNPDLMEQLAGAMGSRKVSLCAELLLKMRNRR